MTEMPLKCRSSCGHPITAEAELVSLSGRGGRLLHSNICRLSSDGSNGSNGSGAEMELFKFVAEYRPLPRSLQRKRPHQILEGQQSNCFPSNNAQMANLQLQPRDGEDGAKRKDRIEVKLQCLVCTEQVSLSGAQHEIADHWQAAYHKYALVKCNRRTINWLQGFNDRSTRESL